MYLDVLPADSSQKLRYVKGEQAGTGRNAHFDPLAVPWSVSYVDQISCRAGCLQQRGMLSLVAMRYGEYHCCSGKISMLL